MAYCEKLAQEVDLEQQEPGVLTCPCGDRLDEDTLAVIATVEVEPGEYHGGQVSNSAEHT